MEHEADVLFVIFHSYYHGKENEVRELLQRRRDNDEDDDMIMILPATQLWNHKIVKVLTEFSPISSIKQALITAFKSPYFTNIDAIVNCRVLTMEQIVACRKKAYS